MKMNKNKWDLRFIELAEHISMWSKDKNTKIGAVIVNKSQRIISTGFNGFPIGADDSIEERYHRDKKYFYTEHAERNAIFSAAEKGDSTRDALIYINKYYPCVDCARAIIQSGIKTVICSKPDFKNEKWGESWTISDELFKECGVEVRYIEDIIKKEE
jgi:dCMP deaminase